MHNQFGGMGNTIRMRIAVSPALWQPWASVLPSLRRNRKEWPSNHCTVKCAFRDSHYRGVYKRTSLTASSTMWYMCGGCWLGTSKQFLAASSSQDCLYQSPSLLFCSIRFLPGLRTIYTREININGARALKNSNKPYTFCKI